MIFSQPRKIAFSFAIFRSAAISCFALLAKSLSAPQQFPASHCSQNRFPLRSNFLLRDFPLSALFFSVARNRYRFSSQNCSFLATSQNRFPFRTIFLGRSESLLLFLATSQNRMRLGKQKQAQLVFVFFILRFQPL